MTLFNSGTLRGGCPVCGEPHAACGSPSDSVPADRLEVAAMGGPLKKYEVTMPSGVTTVMKLNDADARRYGVLAEPASEAPSEPERVDATAGEVANKARRPAPRAKGGRSGDSST